MDLIEFAHANGLAATKALSRSEQKELGQYMTPPSVARFMAGRSLPSDDLKVVRVLEPAGGAGVLVAAVVDALLRRSSLPDEIEVTIYEIDGRLIPLLRRLTSRMRQLAARLGVKLSASIRRGNFLLSPQAKANQPVADVIIANPPYFKLGAHDECALAHPYAVHGQPNIYGLFMAACAGLVSPAGRWCFITPRSWTNGAYFAAVRRHLFRCLHIDAVHVFESRRDHFTDDEVLQEAMITWATAQAMPFEEVIISCSNGSHDLEHAQLKRLPVAQVIGDDDARMIALPTGASADVFAQWTSTLDTYGLKVSTGPVVAFRAEKYLKEKATAATVPLLWMQHIDRMKVQWPINKKREYIASNGLTAWMLVPNSNMVVMRRFSPKEDQRRITAAPYIAGSLPGTVLGLENHTNYIYRPGGKMAAREARGLAAFLNSRVVDAYLRTVAGNTQINATDLRKLPLPPSSMFSTIGKSVRVGTSLEEVDRVVESVLGISALQSTAA